MVFENIPAKYLVRSLRFPNQFNYTYRHNLLQNAEFKELRSFPPQICYAQQQWQPHPQLINSAPLKHKIITGPSLSTQNYEIHTVPLLKATPRIYTFIP